MKGNELTFKTNQYQSVKVLFIFKNGKWIQGNQGTLIIPLEKL
jgi:hypothetical protein